MAIPPLIPPSRFTQGLSQTASFGGPEGSHPPGGVPEGGPKLSRLGELLNTQKNVHFFAPLGSPQSPPDPGPWGGPRGVSPPGISKTYVFWPIFAGSGLIRPDPPGPPSGARPGRAGGNFPEIRGAPRGPPRGPPRGAPGTPPGGPFLGPPGTPLGTPFWGPPGDPPGALPGDPRGTPGGWSPPSNPPELGRLSCGPAWVPAGVQSARGASLGV